MRENLTRHVQEAEVVAIVDVIHDAAKQTAQRFGIARASGDPEEIFSSKDVDAVAICSSTETHSEYIIRVARAGKHAFCEKPIALDLPAVDAALAAVKEVWYKIADRLQPPL